jgi:hypothetical protein
VLKIYPTAFRIGVTIVSRSEYYTTGKGMGRSQIEEGGYGQGRENDRTSTRTETIFNHLVVERNTEC